MNYMEKTAEALGVELGEEFYLAKSGEKDTYLYKLTVDGMFVNKGRSGEWEEVPITFVWTLRGVCSIVKIPRKPQKGENYYLIGSDGSVDEVDWRGDFFDTVLYRSGNCFHTKEEAERNINAYLQWLKLEPITDWRVTK